MLSLQVQMLLMHQPLFGQHLDTPMLPPDVLSWTGCEQPHQVLDQLSQRRLASVHICMPDQGKAFFRSCHHPLLSDKLTSGEKKVLKLITSCSCRAASKYTK